MPAVNETSLKKVLAPSLAYLAHDGAAWMHGESPLNKENGCISCHVVGFALWSHNAVARRGLPANRAEIEALSAEAMEFIGRPGKGRAVTWGQLLLGRAEFDGEANSDWNGTIEGILGSQEVAGHWRARGQFPGQRRPEAESNAVATMWTSLALHSIADRQDQDAGTPEKSLAWLARSANVVSSEWLAMRLLTEIRFGDQGEAADLLARLIDEQRSDGGWSWLLAENPEGRGDPSNAYSTGVALYALRQADLPRSHSAVAAAADYLLTTQLPDGTWKVSSQLTSSEPSPAKDYVYEYWGTAWAVIALSEMFEGPPEAPQAVGGL